VSTTGTPPKGPAGKGKGGKLGFLKDKRVLYGLAAAGGLGLVVLLKKGGGDASASDPNQNGSTGPSTYDSSSMDSYDAISQIGQGLSDQLGGYTDQLTDILTQLGQVNGPTSGGGTTTSPPINGGGTTSPPIIKKPVLGTIKPKPVPKPAAKSYVTTTKFTTASAARGKNWTSTLSTIASHYHESLSTLLKLNPSIKNPNKIGVKQKIRVK
jgi:hypothetical protein